MPFDWRQPNGQPHSIVPCLFLFLFSFKLIFSIFSSNSDKRRISINHSVSFVWPFYLRAIHIDSTSFYEFDSLRSGLLYIFIICSIFLFLSHTQHRAKRSLCMHMSEKYCLARKKEVGFCSIQKNIVRQHSNITLCDILWHFLYFVDELTPMHLAPHS